MEELNAANTLPWYIIVFLSIVGWAAKNLPSLLTSLIKSHIDNANLQGALIKANEIVCSVVARINAVIIPEIKKAAADGVITRAEGKKIASQALSEAKEAMGEEGKKLLKLAFGWTEEQLDTWLSGKIEAAVASAKPLKTIAQQAKPDTLQAEASKP